MDKVTERGRPVSPSEALGPHCAQTAYGERAPGKERTLFHRGDGGGGLDPLTALGYVFLDSLTLFFNRWNRVAFNQGAIEC